MDLGGRAEASRVGPGTRTGSLESAVQVYEVATDKLEKICSVPDSWDEIKTFVSEALGE